MKVTMSGATSSSDPEPDGDLNFADQLFARIPLLLPDHPRVISILPISAPGGHHANVRRVVLSSGNRIIAKRHMFAFAAKGQPHDYLTVEENVSSRLKDAGCAVPSVLAIDRDHDTVLFEDAGTFTLDDATQTRSPLERSRLANEALDALVFSLGVLESQKAELAGLTTPGCDAQSVRESFLNLTEHFSVDRLRPLYKEDTDKSADALRQLVCKLAEASTVLGPTDYNARNIVIDQVGRVRILEWSKLGFDWPERRIVQYLTSLGAGRTGSRPRSLVDRWIVERYAASAAAKDPASAAALLDAHHLVFHVLLAIRCASTMGEIPGTVRTALTEPLSNDPDTCLHRKSFAAPDTPVRS
jgi:hypothetical protein